MSVEAGDTILIIDNIAKKQSTLDLKYSEHLIDMPRTIKISKELCQVVLSYYPIWILSNKESFYFYRLQWPQNESRWSKISPDAINYGSEMNIHWLDSE